MGRTRIALNPSYKNGNQNFNESFFKDERFVFNPALKILEWQKQGKINLISNALVESFEEKNQGVTLNYKFLNEGSFSQINTEKVVLCAGAIGSARIVANSYKLYNENFELLDNPGVTFPMLLKKVIGREALNNDFIPTFQNTICFAENGIEYICNLIDIRHIPDSVLLNEIPLPASFLPFFREYILSSLVAGYLFLPSSSWQGGQVRFSEDQPAEVTAPKGFDYSNVQRPLLEFFGNLGIISPKFMWKPQRFGKGIHYAGTLKYEDAGAKFKSVDKNGKLNGTSSVFVADGSVFRYLPAKNFSYTLVANALKIAEGL
jgi:hypothetical protein